MNDDEYLTVQVTYRPNQYGGLNMDCEVIDQSDQLSDEFWRRLWDDETIDCGTLGIQDEDGHECPACREG